MITSSISPHEKNRVTVKQVATQCKEHYSPRLVQRLACSRLYQSTTSASSSKNRPPSWQGALVECAALQRRLGAVAGGVMPGNAAFSSDAVGDD